MRSRSALVAIDILKPYVARQAPGLQYLILDATGPVFERTDGWADLRNRSAVTPETSFMAYSMTKTITAIAVLQLVEDGSLGLNDPLDAHLPHTPYAGRGITLRQLLTHTSGLPNPLPLRWVHTLENHADFSEDEALERVMKHHARLSCEPGRRYAYSNVGYWLLGKVIERATRKTYPAVVADRILGPLGLTPDDMGFAIANPARHAKGYLRRLSLMNAVKGLLIDREFVGQHEDGWVHIKPHYVNGPAFGGLVTTARGFGRILQDQLQAESRLLGRAMRHVLETEQRNTAGRSIPMTVGWHVGALNGTRYLFKEGGGGGFHGEMRLYPSAGVGSVVLGNGTQLHAGTLLDELDREFLGGRAGFSPRLGQVI
jgi:D-alanyl-D-alanine carboxypeptidase